MGEVLEDPFRSINLAGQLNETVVPESEGPPLPPNNVAKGIMWGSRSSASFCRHSVSEFLRMSCENVKTTLCVKTVDYKL